MQMPGKATVVRYSRFAPHHDMRHGPGPSAPGRRTRVIDRSKSVDLSVAPEAGVGSFGQDLSVPASALPSSCAGPACDVALSRGRHGFLYFRRVGLPQMSTVNRR